MDETSWDIDKTLGVSLIITSRYKKYGLNIKTVKGVWGQYFILGTSNLGEQIR